MPQIILLQTCTVRIEIDSSDESVCLVAQEHGNAARSATIDSDRVAVKPIHCRHDNLLGLFNRGCFVGHLGMWTSLKAREAGGRRVGGKLQLSLFMVVA